MLRIALEYVKPSMVTSRNIYNANGSLLLGKDCVLDPNFIRRLANLNIDAIYVKNPFCDIAPAEEILHETTRVKAVKLTKTAFEAFQKTRSLNVVGMMQVLQKILEDILSHKHVMIHLTDIRTRDDYTFGHSINVCLISAMIGVKMRLSEQQLTDMAMGALLHDVGLMMISPEIVNKNQQLSADEYAVVKEHTSLGFEVLRKQTGISLIAAHVAYQHHEDYDGSGYHRGVSGEEIHRCARIVAVADIYDALTSERAYRQAMLPHEAYEVILGSRGRKLDPQIVDVFLENVALFPIGTMVLLDTNEIGVVTEIRPKLQARPTLKIIRNAKGQRLSEGRSVDLTQELTRFIVKVYKPEEIATIKMD